MPLALIDLLINWWTQLNLAKQLFYGLGLAAGLIAFVLVILAIFGMEHDDAVDALTAPDSVGDAHDGGGIFSLKPLTGFFLGFGWAGGSALEGGLGLGWALSLAFVAGGAFMGLIVFLFRAILRMRSDGTARIEDTVGASGTVYLTIPPHSGTGGQVVVSFHGRQETYEAVSAGAAPLPSGAKVKVLRVLDPRTVVVEPLL